MDSGANIKSVLCIASSKRSSLDSLKDFAAIAYSLDRFVLNTPISSV